MSHIKIVLTIILLQFVFQSQAQKIEHDYKVGPQNVTCDSLIISSEEMSVAIALVREATYRFKQQFRLTRKNGLQGGEFLSCNGISGFVIVRFDNAEVLYLDVEKSIWESFRASSDPEGFYIFNKVLWEKYE